MFDQQTTGWTAQLQYHSLPSGKIENLAIFFFLIQMMIHQDKPSHHTGLTFHDLPFFLQFKGQLKTHIFGLLFQE